MAKSSQGREMTYLMLIVLSFFLGALLSYLYLSGSGSVRCDQFKEPSFQGICYTNLAVDRMDVSICASLVGKGSVNGCYKNVAIAAQDGSICARIDDGLLKDSCYNRVGAISKDKTVCDKISDVNLKAGCYSEIGLGNQTTVPIENPPSNDPGQDNSTITISETTNYKGQNLTVVSTYLSKKYIFFQIKAPFSNNISINMKDVTFWVSDSSYPINQWSGELNGPSCTDLSTLRPGQNCFGRIDNTTCLMGDSFKISLPGGFVGTKEISGCDFR
jgi:hypothetical protein